MTTIEIRRTERPPKFLPSAHPTGAEGVCTDHRGPHCSSLRKLYCRTGYHICISQDGDVYGSNDDSDQNAVMELAATAPGVITIKGVVSGLYLAFNEKSRLVASNQSCEASMFFENILPNDYNVYLSHKYQKKKWYIGINKRGKPKSGRRTRKRKKAAHFVPRYVC